MPKASKETATEHVEVEGYEGHLEKLEGGYTVAFERYTADADLTPFFAGLPDDRCQRVTRTTRRPGTRPCSSRAPRSWSSARRTSSTTPSRS